MGNIMNESQQRALEIIEKAREFVLNNADVSIVVGVLNAADLDSVAGFYEESGSVMGVWGLLQHITNARNDMQSDMVSS